MQKIVNAAVKAKEYSIAGFNVPLEWLDPL